MSIRSFLKKHFYLMLLCALILLIFLAGGYIVANYFNDVDYIQYVPDSNSSYFIIWRGALYITLFLSWKKIIDYLTGRNSNNILSVVSLHKLYRYQYNILAYCLVFEILVVQEAFEKLIMWVMSYGG